MSRSVIALSVLVLLAPAASAQCAVAPPSGCAVVGPGHPPPIGSIPSTLTWPAGAAPLCFSFGVPPGGLGVVVLSLGPCPVPQQLGAPPLCVPGFLYPAPVNFFFLAPGAPASLCFMVNPALRGIGIPICIQGFSFGAAGCARATDGYQLIL